MDDRRAGRRLRAESRRLWSPFCNSVIEHVGRHAMRQRVAELVQAPPFWVRMPYRYFTVEPRCLFQVSSSAGCRTVRNHTSLDTWIFRAESAGHIRRATAVELLGHIGMTGYFAESTVLTGRLAGLAKFIIVGRSS